MYVENWELGYRKYMEIYRNDIYIFYTYAQNTFLLLLSSMTMYIQIRFCDKMNKTIL